MSDLSTGSVTVRAAEPLSPRPAAATTRGSLFLSELNRLRRRRLVLALVLLGVVALLVAIVTIFATHSTDVAAARADAQRQAQQATQEQLVYQRQCESDPSMPQADKDAGACAPWQPTADDFFSDPRFVAQDGLPMVALGIGVAGALLAALLAATATGADWSSRSIITLLAWEPRRLRFLAMRMLAIAIFVAVVGVLAQALALGLASLVVELRGTWHMTSRPSEGSSLLSPPHFWSQLVGLQLRTVAIMVLVSLMSAALATVFRSTGGVLGVAFGWFAVVEVAGHALFGETRVVRYLLTENLGAALLPGGSDLYIGQQLTANGMAPRVVHLSNGDGLLYLVVLAALLCVLAGALLRRRDL